MVNKGKHPVVKIKIEIVKEGKKTEYNLRSFKDENPFEIIQDFVDNKLLEGE